MTVLSLDTPVLARQYETLSDKQYLHGKVLIEDLGIQAGEKVLDVGCGTGRLSAYVADLVGDNGLVVAADPLPLRLELARTRSRPNLKFSVAAAEDLANVPGAPFDAIYLNSVFHWLADKDQALREIRRLLKPGGRLGISAASKERPHAFQGLVSPILAQQSYAQYCGAGTEGPLYKLSMEETKALLENWGFRVESVAIRTFVDYFDDPQTVIDFSTASSFGNFLSELPGELRQRAIEEIKTALERKRTPRGIELARNLIFTVASLNRSE